MRSRPSYTPEFRADAVELLRRSDRTLSQVADDLGVSKFALRDWYKRDEMAKKSKRRGKVPIGKSPQVGKDETAEERANRLERENVALRKENDSLRMDREILKKAAAFFARENE
jgi:transposase-like protein